MIKNYLKTALRNLQKHKAYTFINVFGLAFGMACCMVITLFVQHKLSYDRFFPNADRTYRIHQTFKERVFARTQPGLAHAVSEHFPEVEQTTALLPFDRRLFATDDERFYLDEVFHVDDSFFEVFPFTLQHGNPETALGAPGRMVITEKLAERLFGDTDPMGQILVFENKTPYEITGILEEVPSNTHLRFNVLLSLTEGQRASRYGAEIQWQYGQDLTYVVLHTDSDPEVFEQKLAAFEESRRPERLRATRFVLQPLTRIHLHSDQVVRGDPTPQSDVRYLYLFAAIAVLILLIACINYMNLATARSVQRAREVGVRKVVGARRTQIMRQFFSESMLVALLALPFALVLVDVAQPMMERFAGEALVAPSMNIMVLALLGVVILVGFLSGIYPALFLSRFQPIDVLKGSAAKSPGKRSVFRGGLVVFQFAASIILALITLTTLFQLQYIQNTRLGFDKEHVVMFNGYAVIDQYKVLQEELLKQPHVQSVAFGPSPGVGRYVTTVTITTPQTETEQEVAVLSVSDTYVETLGMNVIAGDGFLSALSTDDEGVVLLSASTVELLGLKENPVGQRLRIAHRLRNRPDIYTVAGVVEDFHNASLHEPMRPVVFMPFERGFVHRVLVRLNPGNLARGLREVNAVWRRFAPDEPLQYTFLDEEITRQYLAEQKLARLFGTFAALAMVLACLGLFGLAASTAEQRTKEIGIRKVLGASVPSITALLSKDFLKLVVIALGVAAPLAYVAMNRWLDTFAYRIELSWWIFLLAGLTALAIALLTVSYQSIKAALADPVRALRYE